MFESSLSASRSRSVNGGNGAGVISLISAFPVASDRGGGPWLLHILGSKLSDKAIESERVGRHLQLPPRLRLAPQSERLVGGGALTRSLSHWNRYSSCLVA